MSGEGSISLKELWLNESIKLPRLFLTWDDGRNPKSIQVMLELCTHKPISQNGLDCEVFPSERDLDQYLKDRKIGYSEIVEFVDFRSKSSTMSYACIRYRSEDFIRIPHRSSAPWVVAVNPSVSDKRALNVANQVFADFQTNFARRLSSNQFPWGQASSPTNRASRRMTKWRLRQQGRLPVRTSMFV